MFGALSRTAITADLEAMHAAGIGGACLMTIKGPDAGPSYDKSTITLSEDWWDYIEHAFAEADRLGLTLSMGISDGFATAGGPWITPENSMQRLSCSQLNVQGGAQAPLRLPTPESRECWYKDLRVLAYPTQGLPLPPPSRVSSNLPQSQPARIFNPSDDFVFRAETDAWFIAAYEQPQTLRSLTVVHGGGNYQANRLTLEASQDGVAYSPVCSLEAPRHGWSDSDLATTHSIPATTARYFRFSWSALGSEPGGEDLDSAKWKPILKLRGLQLSSAPVIHHFEGKNSSVWRLASSSETYGLSDADCLPAASVLDLSSRLRADGTLDWTVPAGAWTILRIGTSTTGRVNATAGAGKGLECDKLSASAVRIQFEHWFLRLLEKAGPTRTPRVLDTLHVDSWECGSQNWSPVLSSEFLRRRGYPLENYMPVLAGVPLDSVVRSEQFLHDFRLTLSELVNENFFGTLASLVRSHGLKFSAECVAPIMASDGLLPFSQVDVPMGEFWLRSPSHDKPNDIRDAISGAHIYGKRLVQAEAFTELRMFWDEHPGMLKTLGDLHFARGINRFMLHVFTHNPWLERRPGMTLDSIGVYFQRDQTWWPQASAWTDYLSRAQYLLQQGTPAVDIAVFSGEELPSRSFLPDQVLPLLPGLFSSADLAREQARQANLGQPRRTLPVGVTASANLIDSSTWVAPLQGYTYDSLNRDALLRFARVERGRIVLPGGASYAVLVLPSSAALKGRPFMLSLELAEKLHSLVSSGATLVLAERPLRQPGQSLTAASAQRWSSVVDDLWGALAQAPAPSSLKPRSLGQGRIFHGPWLASSLEALALPPDFIATEAGAPASGVAWCHRELVENSLYWISNQLPQERVLELSLRAAADFAEIWDPLTGQRTPSEAFSVQDGRAKLRLRLAPNGSGFVVLSRSNSSLTPTASFPILLTPALPSRTLTGPWTLSFSPREGGPAEPLSMATLESWSSLSDPRVKYYSGTATYELSFDWSGPLEAMALDLGSIADIARIELNGVACGVLWTPPFRVSLGKALRRGTNLLRIQLTNTWANRLIGDHLFPGRPGATWTQAAWLLEGRPLLPAGLLGPVRIHSLTTPSSHAPHLAFPQPGSPAPGR